MKKFGLVAVLVLFASSVQAERASILALSAGYSGYSGDAVEAFEGIGGEIKGGITYGVEYVTLQKNGFGFSLGFQNIPYESTLDGVKAESDWRHFIVGALYGLNSNQSNVFPYIGIEYHAINASDLEFSGCGNIPEVCSAFNSIATFNDDLGSSYGVVLGSYVLGDNKDVSYGFGLRAISANSGEELVYQGFVNVGMSF